MNLYLRLIGCLLRACRQPRLAPTDPLVVTFRVLPTDVDLNGHMNNGRYLTIMDLGRLALFSRAGLLGPALKNRWRPVVGASTMRYLRVLRPFQAYQLRVCLLCWDDKWAYVRHTFEFQGRVIAVGMVKALMVSPQGNVAMRDVLAAMGYPDRPSPPMPEEVADWERADAALGMTVTRYPRRRAVVSRLAT